MLTAINLIAFQLGWFASILGAAKGIFWLGPLVVCVVFSTHLLLTGDFLKECILGLIITFLGFLADTLLTAFGVYSPVPHIFKSPYSPPWLIFMWLNFATLLNVSIKWLSRKYLLSSFLGGIGGAFAYYGGDALGVLKYRDPIYTNILITGIVWAGLTPLFFCIANRLNRYTFSINSGSIYSVTYRQRDKKSER